MNNIMKGAALDAAKELIGMSFGGYEVSDIKTIEVEKIGGVQEGIEVDFKGSSVGAIFYGISSVEELKDAIEKSIVEGMQSVIDNVNLNNNALYRLRAINIEANKSYLKNKPYKQVYDLALIGFIDFGRDRRGVVTNAILQSLGISFDEFYEAALDNIRAETKVVPIIELLNGLIGEDEDFLQPADDDCPLYVVGDGCHPEATALLGDQEWLEKQHEKIGDFYIIPSSINELLISQAVIPAEEILSMVGMVNSGCVAPEEVLSNNIYKFDGTLSIISALGTATA